MATIKNLITTAALWAFLIFCAWWLFIQGHAFTAMGYIAEDFGPHVATAPKGISFNDDGLGGKVGNLKYRGQQFYHDNFGEGSIFAMGKYVKDDPLNPF